MKGTPAERILAANDELLAKGRTDAAPEYFTEDYVAHLTGRELRGASRIAKFVEQIRRAFPDLRVEVEVLATEGDRLAWQRTLRATHEDSYAGFPGTGRKIVWRDMVVSRLEDGRIAEEWAISDLAEQLLAARR